MLIFAVRSVCHISSLLFALLLATSSLIALIFLIKMYVQLVFENFIEQHTEDIELSKPIPQDPSSGKPRKTLLNDLEVKRLYVLSQQNFCYKCISSPVWKHL